MKIDELWRSMEAEAANDSTGRWLLRRAVPDLGYPLLAALEPSTRLRALLLPTRKDDVPPRRDWPECRGLQLQLINIDGSAHFAIRLRDAGSSDVFTALAEDVAPRVTAAGNSAQAASALLGRLRRWQHFLAAGQIGLTVERERGLWGELHFFKTQLLPKLGVDASVNLWKASSAAHQDFQGTAGAVEVKTTAAKKPQNVRVTSERQLDDVGVGALFLHVIVIDEREVPPTSNLPGSSLPSLVTECRALLGNEGAAITAFEDQLTNAGFFDVHAAKYEGRRRTIRSEFTFRVRDGFPRLTERMLPSGVGETTYYISLESCAPFTITSAEMLEAFSSTL